MSESRIWALVAAGTLLALVTLLAWKTDLFQIKTTWGDKGLEVKAEKVAAKSPDPSPEAGNIDVTGDMDNTKAETDVSGTLPAAGQTGSIRVGGSVKTQA